MLLAHQGVDAVSYRNNVSGRYFQLLVLAFARSKFTLPVRLDCCHPDGSICGKWNYTAKDWQAAHAAKIATLLEEYLTRARMHNSLDT